MFSFFHGCNGCVNVRSGLLCREWDEIKRENSHTQLDVAYKSQSCYSIWGQDMGWEGKKDTFSPFVPQFNSIHLSPPESKILRKGSSGYREGSWSLTHSFFLFAPSCSLTHGPLGSFDALSSLSPLSQFSFPSCQASHSFSPLFFSSLDYRSWFFLSRIWNWKWVEIILASLWLEKKRETEAVGERGEKERNHCDDCCPSLVSLSLVICCSCTYLWLSVTRVWVMTTIPFSSLSPKTWLCERIGQWIERARELELWDRMRELKKGEERVCDRRNRNRILETNILHFNCVM